MSLTKQDIPFKFLAIEDFPKNGLTLKSAYGRTNDFLSWLFIMQVKKEQHQSTIEIKIYH